MNELIALGVGLTDVIRMVTVNAATMLGLTDELGSLAQGRVADVSVLAIDEDDWTLQDSLGGRIKTDKRLRPVLARARAKCIARSRRCSRSRSPEVA
jgi:dihydroorotase